MQVQVRVAVRVQVCSTWNESESDLVNQFESELGCKSELECALVIQSWRESDLECESELES